jgi:hypothetical protein
MISTSLNSTLQNMRAFREMQNMIGDSVEIILTQVQWSPSKKKSLHNFKDHWCNTDRGMGNFSSWRLLSITPLSGITHKIFSILWMAVTTCYQGTFDSSVLEEFSGKWITEHLEDMSLQHDRDLGSNCSSLRWSRTWYRERTGTVNQGF